MCVFVYIRVRACVHVRACLFESARVHTREHAYVSTFHDKTLLCGLYCTYKQMKNFFVGICTRAHVSAYTRACTRARTHARACAPMCKYLLFSYNSMKFWASRYIKIHKYVYARVRARVHTRVRTCRHTRIRMCENSIVKVHFSKETAVNLRKFT